MRNELSFFVILILVGGFFFFIGRQTAPKETKVIGYYDYKSDARLDSAIASISDKYKTTFDSLFSLPIPVRNQYIIKRLDALPSVKPIADSVSRVGEISPLASISITQGQMDKVGNLILDNERLTHVNKLMADDIIRLRKEGQYCADDLAREKAEADKQKKLKKKAIFVAVIEGLGLIGGTIYAIRN